MRIQRIQLPIAVLGAAALILAAGCDDPTVPADLPLESAEAATAADAATEITIKISPHALVLGVEGTWVTVHTSVPYGSADNSTLELNGVPYALAFADDRGYLVVKFRQGAIEALVTPPEATLTLTGLFTSGVPFYGSDVIVVRERGPKAAAGSKK